MFPAAFAAPVCSPAMALYPDDPIADAVVNAKHRNDRGEPDRTVGHSLQLLPTSSGPALDGVGGGVGAASSGSDGDGELPSFVVPSPPRRPGKPPDPAGRHDDRGVTHPNRMVERNASS